MIFHNDKILTPKMPVGPPEKRRRSMKKHRSSLRATVAFGTYCHSTKLKLTVSRIGSGRSRKKGQPAMS